MLKLGILDVAGTKYTLKIGQEYFVGRKSNEFSHDIEINDQSVDIKHSIIDLKQSSTPQLFDVSSKHGTFVDDLKIPRFKGIPLPKTSKIRFGDVDTCLQLVFEGDSGFLDERLNSPTNDTSEIICNTPEHIVSSGSRLKNSLKTSLTSTPHESTAVSFPSASKPADNFLIPSVLQRTSIGSNTSARSADSFYIPETQYPPEANNNRTNNSTDISFYSNTSNKKNLSVDDDFFIPETQEVVSSAIPLRNHARVAFPSDDVNETLSQEDRIPSSQFRICTQDFNGSEESLSNHSGDILANVPLSMVIPTIQHEPVQIDEFVDIQEDDMEKEMSILQWSRKTLENDPDGSVTPDGLFDVVGSVTSDLIQVIRKSSDKALSQCSTPDIFAIADQPEALATETNAIIDDLKIEEEIVAKEENLESDIPFEIAKIDKEPEGTENIVNEVNKLDLEIKEAPLNETDYPPTQVFFKPIPVNKSITRPLLPSPEREEDCDLLPETQVFAPPIIKPKPVDPHVFTKPEISSTSDDKPSSSTNSLNSSKNNHVFALPQASPKLRVSLKTQTSPKPQASPKPVEPHKSLGSTVLVDEDDLPPTQVFLKDEHIPVPVVANVFSSTLLDCGLQQLSENSFKTKFNKLLDSDDDEMDEVIAPDLVKQMRQSLEKPETPPAPITPPEKQPTVPQNQEENIASTKKSEITPDNDKFRLPVKTPRNNFFKTPAVSIDNFLLTPDFLGKELSKDSQLQREAEVNWRNIVLEKRNKALFGEGNDANDNSTNNDSDNSDDSFIDLLPKRRETRSRSLNRAASEKGERAKVEEEVVCGRITRRKSTLKAITIAKEESDKKEVGKRGRKKNDSKTNDIQERTDHSKSEKGSKNDKNGKDSKSDKDSNHHRNSKHDKDSKHAKDLEGNEYSNNDKESKADKDSKNYKDSKHDKDRDSKNVKKSTTERVSRTEKVSTREKGKKEIELETKSSKKIESNSKAGKIGKDDELVNHASLVRNNVVKDSSISKSNLTKGSSGDENEKLPNRNSRAIKVPSEDKSKSRTVSKESHLTRTSSSTSCNTSKERKEKIESPKESVVERTRGRRKIQEAPKVEEKTSRSRATKRNAEVSKTSSKATKINKLDGVGVGSNANCDKPSPRITRLRSCTELREEDKITSINNSRKIKEDAKEEPSMSATKKKNNRVNEECVDLTDCSYNEEKSIQKKTAKKRKSQADYVYNGRKSAISGSQSSSEYNDSDRSLRRKSKTKIALTSCSPQTRETLVRYSGRAWDFTEDPKECDVLILEAGNRTYKLLVAIARGVPVVKVDWLREVILMRSTDVPFEKYIFDEPNFQKRHKFVMRNSLHLAKTTSLFSGMNFMMTPNIIPKPEEMKDIIACAGGTLLANIPTSKDDKAFYLVSEKVDSQLWYRYRRECPNVKVVTAISLMASVMQQSLDPLNNSTL